MKNITISDVAEALGVSKTTVSRAISGKGRIGEKTRKRVLDYIEEHNYTPNVIARGLAQSKTYNIGVVIPTEYGINDLPFFQSCLFGIQEAATELGYDILLTLSSPEDTSRLERVVVNRKVDGLILMRTFVEDKQANMLVGKGIPFVTVGGTDVKQAVWVDQDHKTACRELTSLLIEQKLERIALIGGDEKYMVTQKRLCGYLEAFEAAGSVVRKDLIYLGMDNPARLEQCVDEILEKQADCIVSMDDAICSNVLKKLRREHIHVPGDIKAASFYNSSILENHVPSITSLSFDERELGMEACRSLMELIEGKGVSSMELPGYRVVFGESTTVS